MLFQKSSQALCLFAVVSSVTADSFTWVGRSTSFADASNWNGETPAGSVGPGGISMGTKNGPTLVSEVPARSYQVGKTIQFEGPTTLLLGDGVGTTTLFFDTATTKASSSFMPSSDFLCNTNWNVTIDGLALGAPTPPCSGDVINIQTDASYFVQLPSNVQVSGVKFGNSQVQTTCPVASKSLTGGKSSVGFASTCKFTQGNAASTCPDSSCTTTSTVTSITATSTTTATTTIKTTPTADPKGGGTEKSTGNSDAGGSTIIIVIVVVVVLVLLAVLVGVFFVVKKKKAEDADRAVQSFENPMYDDVAATTTEEKPDESATGYMDVPMSSNALYDNVDEDGGTFGGYDEDNTGATGYMDVNPSQGGTGYMDVAPVEGSDDDADDDDEDV